MSPTANHPASVEIRRHKEAEHAQMPNADQQCCEAGEIAE
jgi:hypothetical protein